MASSNQKINVTIEPDEPKNFTPTMSDIQKVANFMSRMSEKGLVNEKSGSSIAIRETGQINLSAGKFAQHKLNPSGAIDEISASATVTTNRMNMELDEMVYNHHKLNPHLLEYSDFRLANLALNHTAVVGNFCLNGSILVKAWDHQLKRYMLIRRPARMPMFGVKLNVPEIPKGLGINDPLYIEDDMIGLSNGGYQVNAKISDKGTNIGKKGSTRGGIGSTSTVNNTGGYTSEIKGIEADVGTVFAELKKFGYNDVAAAAICGNIMQESRFETDATNGTHTGLCQWDNKGRWANLCSQYSDPYSVSAQLNFLYYEATNTRYPDECCPEAMNKFTDVSEAARHWVIWFEGGVNEDGSIQEESERVGFSNEIYDMYAGKSQEAKK